MTPKVDAKDFIYDYSIKSGLLCGHYQGVGSKDFMSIGFLSGTSGSMYDIDNGFNVTDPFMTNIEKFSFYINLDSVDDVNLLSGDDKYPVLQTAPQIISLSSCGQGTFHTIYMSAPYYTRYGYTGDAPNNWVVINASNLPSVGVHEAGHSLANLSDEYPKSGGTMEYKDEVYINDPPNATRIKNNCTVNPWRSYRSSSGGKLYGATSIKGCFNAKATFWGLKFPIFRPTNTSLMHYGDSGNDKFNTISCGYVLSFINGKNPKDNFEECHHMDVEDKNVVYSSTIFGAIFSPSTTVNPGSSMKITGSGFSAENNSVEFELTGLIAVNDSSDDKLSGVDMLASVMDALRWLFPVNITVGNQMAASRVGLAPTRSSPVKIHLSTLLASSTDSGGNLDNPLDPNDPLWFIVNDIPSVDGSSIRFIVPEDIIPGTYKVRAATLDTDMSDPILVTVVSSSTPPVVPPSSTTTAPFISTISPSSGLPGTQVKISGSNFDPNSVVTFERMQTKVISRDANSIDFVVFTTGSSSLPGIYRIVVINSDGQRSNSTPFTIINPTPVTITSTSTLFTNNTRTMINDGYAPGNWMAGSANNIPAGSKVNDIAVNVSVSGGYNSDLVLELVAPNGTKRKLINRIGIPATAAGQGGAGMNVTFSDTSPNNIQDVNGSGIITGTYHAMDTLASFGLTDSSQLNGQWTLAMWDLSTGDISYVDSFGVTAVVSNISTTTPTATTIAKPATVMTKTAAIVTSTTTEITKKSNTVVASNMPTNLTANAKIGQIDLSWSKTGIKNGTVIEIYRSTGSSTRMYHLADVGVSKTSFSDTRISKISSMMYGYKLRVKFKDNTFSDYTPVVYVESKK